MKRPSVLIVVVLAVAVLSGAVLALTGQGEFDEVRDATNAYNKASAAKNAGYEEFLSCFDSDTGGMGQHYVDLAALDSEVNATRPEAMVYEVNQNGNLALAGVEYIVPNAEPPAGQTTAPELFGEQFQLVEELNIWAMHAWIWKENPNGAFEAFNPSVGSCPN